MQCTYKVTWWFVRVTNLTVGGMRFPTFPHIRYQKIEYIMCFDLA